MLEAIIPILFFLKLNNIPLHSWTMFSFVIDTGVDAWVVSTFWVVKEKLLWPELRTGAIRLCLWIIFFHELPYCFLVPFHIPIHKACWVFVWLVAILFIFTPTIVFCSLKISILAVIMGVSCYPMRVWFAFAKWLVEMAIFHGLIGYLYIFFGENVYWSPLPIFLIGWWSASLAFSTITKLRKYRLF